MFLLLAVAFAAAGFLHGLLSRSDRRRRIELSLVWLVAGYLGVVMVASL
jgi:hypothetical protein